MLLQRLMKLHSKRIHRTVRTLATFAPEFPSIMISADGIKAKGPFAEAQANFLHPNPIVVQELDDLVERKKVGIVAHFYMDPELQGVLSSMKWPHTFVADSLAMGEAAVKMAKEGARAVTVLGVDFMSESVRANLDSHGYNDIPVYRLSEKYIGCSLAEAAERQAYSAYLSKASETPRSLHVVYINTSLKSKAYAHHSIPTIACTSSNVVQTVLQAFAQVPDIKIWYGPDTYMGENLYEMFQHMATLSDEKIREIHPLHDQKSLQGVLANFDYFKEGNCVVHHMFGDKVTQRVRQQYADAYFTAHFEVPGEMFLLALEAQNAGRGVVGSTSNILNFIKVKTSEALKSGSDEILRFVLGTEAGMITSIVRNVEASLKEYNGDKKPKVEIIFPVAEDAIAQGDGSDGDLSVVPGVSGGEGCSTAGGCATCPFMKMNDLDSLFNVVESIDLDATTDPLLKFRPQQYKDRIMGHSITEIGVHPIVHMRNFMQLQQLSDDLVQDICTRTPGSGCPESK